MRKKTDRLREISIKMTYNWWERGLSNSLKKRIAKVLPVVVEEMKEHFKTDKWPLGAEHYVADVIKMVFGNYVPAYIQIELLKALGPKFSLGYPNDDWDACFMLRKPGKKRRKKKK